MTIDETHCVDCGAGMLNATAAKTGGKCIPCKRGTRAEIEENKKWYAERRRLEKVNEAARLRILQTPNPIFADFVTEEDPLGVLWLVICETVFSGTDEDENIDALSPEARAIYLVNLFNAEVLNGGLHQFFSNSSGNHSHETLQALLKVGATHSVRLFSKAAGAFPEGYVPSDRITRNEQLNKVNEREPKLLDELTSEFYALTDTDTNPVREDIYELLLSFFRSNPEAPIANT
ncbi:MAG: DMP19 family protein [Acidobacteriota bacterium]|nr:MAG: DMP19 family protein [Acidobacteriota bacterium]